MKRNNMKLIDIMIVITNLMSKQQSNTGSSKMHSRKNAISHSLKGIYLIQGMRFTMEENAFPD
jgi:hypothetical protein